MIGLTCSKELVLRTDDSRECVTCHYWFCLEKKFKFRQEVCNSCHDLTQKVMCYNDVAIVFVK